MPNSMTGYGCADESGLTVEIKSLNQRYKDVRVKLPRDMTQLEMQLRSLVSDAVQRGKVEVAVYRNMAETSGSGLAINMEFAGAVYNDLRKVASEFGGEVTFRDVIAIPGVLGEEERHGDEQWALISPVVVKALESFLKSRLEEGEKLGLDMSERIDNLERVRESIQSVAAGIPKAYSEKLKANIERIMQGSQAIDEMRLAQEVAIMAEKCDITEELVRLKGHFEAFAKTLKTDGSAGRRLEFILQEINREFNTIGSKSQDSTISMFVIDAKTGIEKIREQLQNVE